MSPAMPVTAKGIRVPKTSTRSALPTLNTCNECHSDQVTQFSAGKHALAWAAMEAMPTTHALPMALTQGMKGCGGCHKLGLKSEEEIQDAQGRRVGLRPRLLRRLPHAARLLGRGSAPAAGLPDLPHGLRPPAVGDVLGLQARCPLPAEAERHLPETTAAPDVPDLPHAATREPRGPDAVGLPCRATAAARGRAVEAADPDHDPASARRARSRRQPHRTPRCGQGRSTSRA